MSVTTWPSSEPETPPGYWDSLGKQDEPSHTNGAAQPPPVIKVIAGHIDKTATLGEAALITAQFPIYQRGSTLVRPVLSEVPASKGRTTMAAGLANISPPALIDRLCQSAEWQKYDGKRKAWTRMDPPPGIASIILSRVGDWTFPRIAGVITTPTIRPNGSLLTAPGYDPVTRLYHAVDASMDVIRHIPATLTNADALKALGDLQHLLKNFPTVTEIDASVALSGLITPVVRGAVQAVPMHAFRASTAGTGKTFLVDVISAISTGRPCPVATVAKSEEETEKRLGGLLIAAFPIVCLDNVNGELGGDLLCQAIERPIIQIRPLGSSEIIEIETRASIFATGNSLRVRGDMTRRCIIATLDAGVERPELRDFDFDPVEAVLADRARYVGACLTIVLAHAKAGFPADTKPLASFSDWSRFVRSALIWLGCADPCASMETAREDDPELSDLKELLTAWAYEIGTTESLTGAELSERIAERTHAEDGSQSGFVNPRMREIVLRVAAVKGVIDGRRLGNFLRNKEGRITNGQKLRKAGSAQGGSIRWQVTNV